MIYAANIAEFILEQKVFSAEKGMINIKNIKVIMIELMKSTTSILNPSSTVLKNSEK